ncbi:metallophosphoesterase [Paenibacillus qinlingensis]|uniref:MPP superfamily phosphohydrolase n=1 Tax=Paenibacillus qinlingensis TaxID=1837343 RepID=A0ABU1NR71_9BACL|nr:metallophosphoesterase [Paenibacillus qinlingensis]MDR6549913.1 putative MPP superfamily phosphohydrolase [Paenibacillus qinlingensis]
MELVITSILVILALGALFILYSTFWVNYFYIQLGQPDKKNFTVVQISDMHGQTHFINGSLSQKVNKVNPDLVMITGDLGSTKVQVERVLAEIRRINCAHLFFVPGNHERYIGSESSSKQGADQAYDACMRTIEESHIAVLVNRGLPFHMGEKRGLVYGFDNSLYDKERMTLSEEELQRYDFVIMLAHSPNIINTALAHEHPSYDLLLVGHTHGGQVRLLGRTIGAYKDFHVGLKRIDERKHFYINRGLGTSRLPIRVGCSPEITVFKIGV